MVFSKRISCIVLSVLLTFAVCAPCALGVFADEVDVDFYFDSDYYISENVFLGGLKYSNSNQYYKSFSKAYVGGAVGVFLENLTSDGSLSGLALISTDADSVKYTISNGSGVRGPSSTYQIDDITVYFSFFVNSASSVYGCVPTSTVLPTLNYDGSLSEADLFSEVVSITGFSLTPPVPDPEPSEDGWTYGTTDLYFTNISDSNFAFNQLNYPFSSFPSKDIIVDDSPSKIIAGAFWDNTSWLSSGSTISGQLQVQFTSPLTTVDNFIQRGFIWFVNGSDPSLSGFQYFEVPSSWEHYFTVWKYGINQWTNEYVFNFELTLPDDLSSSIGFTPVNILIGLYGILPSGSFTTECWYHVQNLVFGYYIPPAGGEPDVPSTPVFNNPDNSSTVIDPSEPTVVDNLNQELGFYDEVWKSYKISESLTALLEEVVGDIGWGPLENALSRLYQSFSYTGSGSIKLPAATIPWGDSNLQLWEEQDIPLAYWFSNLPSSIKVVFGFIIVFSAASACWGICWFFIRKIVSGNYQTNDF